MSTFFRPAPGQANSTVRTPDIEDITSAPPSTGAFATGVTYRFERHYHPYVRTFSSLVRLHGTDALLHPLETPLAEPLLDPHHLDRQQLDDAQRIASNDTNPTFFERRYLPSVHAVDTPYPREDIDFSWEGAYSRYNWEMFFHGPWLVAQRLSQEGRYAKAKRWLESIFHPNHPERGDDAWRWRFRPFLAELAGRVVGHTGAFEQWLRAPFDPHAIARIRLQAYQRAILFAYLDNLIAWGDSLLRQGSLESLNEATQLYLFALDLLGPRPQVAQPRHATTPPTFDSLRAAASAASDAVEISDTGRSTAGVTTPPMSASLWAFCAPGNDKLLGYWDTLEDRLFKLRNSLDLDGNFRVVPLFQPPIDPALLVRATAMGLDLSQIVSQTTVRAMPIARFRPVMALAMSVCNEVKSLGAALLSALEKRDGEALSRLRATHERALLDAVADVRIRQVEEARTQLRSLQISRRTTELRRDHYQRLLDVGESPTERRQLSFLTQINAFSMVASVLNATASLPLAVGTIGVPPESGPFYVGTGIQAAGTAVGAHASALSAFSSRAGVKAGHERRAQDWSLQLKLASQELDQLDAQLAAAELRVQIAERERDNHALQRSNATEVESFLRSKFTNEDLYSWMSGELRTLYRRAYDLAVDLARSAQRSFAHELGRTDVDAISISHGDPTRKQLLAGEHLYRELQELEAAYVLENRRDLELSRDISLAEWDPFALHLLKTTGSCFFDVPEVLFDVDTPGHYHRRIRQVAVSIPCTRGPNTPVSCTVTQVDHAIRRDASLDASLTTHFATDRIVTSTGLRDTGVLGGDDGRFLPFEGQGAIGRWRLQFPTTPSFDPSTVSDVVLHIQYVARDGGARFREQVESAVPQALSELVQARFGGTGMLVHRSLRVHAPDALATLRDGGTASLSPSLMDLPPWARALAPGVVKTLVAFDSDASSATLAVDGQTVVDGGALVSLGLGDQRGFSWVPGEDTNWSGDRAPFEVTWDISMDEPSATDDVHIFWLLDTSV